MKARRGSSGDGKSAASRQGKRSGNSKRAATLNSKSASGAKSKPLHVYGFDTEDDSKGNPTVFAWVGPSGSYWCDSREKFLERLHRLAFDAKREGIRLEFWATNLEYDLVNVFGADRISEVYLQWGKSYLVGARWQGINFRDTVRHLPASVEELGKLVGLPKLNIEFSARRCVRDASITYRMAKALHEIYGTLEERPRLTLASTALNLWQSQYFKSRARAPLPEIWDAAHSAYYGGRTEPFAIGEYMGVRVIDAASMFPWAMVQAPFPVPWGSFRRVRNPETIEPGGIYLARCSSSLPIPVLPYRTKQGMIFPNGTFSGWYVGEELIYFRKMGGKARILRGYEFFETCEPFNRYVGELFDLKQKARGPLRTIYKLLLNALYGKFGQKGERIRSVPLERFERMPKAPTDYRVWNGLVIYRTKGSPPPWSNNLWSAIVTARARIRLHQEMTRIRDAGGSLFYCDTDSVIFSSARVRYPEHVTEPGRFELRGKFRRILIVGKKEYGLEEKPGIWELHAKGIPLKAREEFLRTGRATFQRPFRLIESTRRGRANVWHDVTKERRVSYAKRARNPDGSLAPIIISE